MRGHSVADCAKQARVTRALNMHVHMLEHVHVHVCLHFFPDRITVVFFSKRISDIVYTCLLTQAFATGSSHRVEHAGGHAWTCVFRLFPQNRFPPRKSVTWRIHAGHAFLPQDRPDFPPEI